MVVPPKKMIKFMKDTLLGHVQFIYKENTCMLNNSISIPSSRYVNKYIIVEGLMRAITCC